MPHRRRQPPTFPCPHCGAEVPEGAPACRECGSDDLTGWSEETLYDGLDLPDTGGGAIPDTFEEFEVLSRGPNRRRRLLGWILLALALSLFLGMRRWF